MRNIFVDVVAQRAVKNKYEGSEKKDHWLYYADDKYDVSSGHRLYCTDDKYDVSSDHWLINDLVIFDHIVLCIHRNTQKQRFWTSD